MSNAKFTMNEQLAISNYLDPIVNGSLLMHSSWLIANSQWSS